ncbi:amino acid permease [Atractiella rhizophila]|nr:amino acid permease [Atractiella rhizophila]
MDYAPEEPTIQRKLKARHLQMIAIGGCIGTGLFVGSGGALASGGPVGLFLGYLIFGGVVYTIMTALGEMAAMYPVAGGFVHYASRFFDPALGVALGYNYWYSYAITLPTEMTAAAIVIGYWNSSINVGVWITIFFVACLGFNFLGVRWYGEAEFWFSLTKVVTIVGLILLGLILDLGGGPNHDRIGFRYWKDPGPFVQLNGIPGSWGRFLSFWSVFTQAAFSFLGTEIVALTAGEAANPRRNVPKAIRRVFWRILLFYVLGVFIIGWLVPSNEPRLLNGASDASASPFVIAISNAGISGLPSLINAVILISAWSAGNSDLYASSRTLYGLATSGLAPSFFKYCTKGGVPLYCLIATALFGPLAYLNVSNNGATVFNWFYNISAITGLITWWCILITYIRFYQGIKYHGLNRDDFPYKAPFMPYAAYFGTFFVTVVTITNGFQIFLHGNWSTASFVAAYLSLPIFAVLWVGYKFGWKTRFVRIEDMDFDTGRRELDAMQEEEDAKYQPPQGFLARVWDWIM